MSIRFAAMLLSIAGGSSAVRGAVIDVGYHALLPNTSGQQIEITVTGGESVAGVDLYVQVGDGGPELTNVGLPAGTDGPTITSADLMTGTIFAETTATQFDHERAGIVQILSSGVALADPPPAPQSVLASGRLVMLTIDTTGFYFGTFDLSLSGVLASLDGGPFDTSFIGAAGSAAAATVINGTIEVTVSRNGDYNHDEIVDAADYTVWRNTLGQSGPGLAADGDGNLSIEANDYLVWKDAYGTFTGPSGSGSGGLHSAVPEPTIAAGCLIATILVPFVRCRRGDRH